MKLFRNYFAVEVELKTESGLWLPQSALLKQTEDGHKFLDNEYFLVAFASENCNHVKPGMYAIPMASCRRLTEMNYKGKKYHIYDENQMVSVMAPEDFYLNDDLKQKQKEMAEKLSAISRQHDHDQVYNGPLTQKAPGHNKGSKKYYDR